MSGLGSDMTQENTQGRRLLPIAGFAALCVIVGLCGFLFMTTITSYMLEFEAREDTQEWADRLSRELPDLPAIAQGEATSERVVALFKQSASGGRIYTFRVYDAKGRLKLRSDDMSLRFSIGQPIEKIDRHLASSLRRGQPATIVRRSNVAGEPDFYASNLLPIMAESKSVGWLVTYVDQSRRHALFFRMSMIVSLVVGALLLVAPLLGFWYRAKQKVDFERQLEHISQRDALTGLVNRPTFLGQVNEQLTQNKDSASALIEIELTGLPLIAQHHGTEGAEGAVVAAAERLRALVDGANLVARVDYARFAVFSAAASDPMDVLSLAKKLTRKLDEPLPWNGAVLLLQSHAGIALAPLDGADASALTRSAELALTSAIEQKTPGYGFFNPQAADKAKRQTSIQRAVAEATQAKSFRLDYQPVYGMRTGELTGFESLIRLHDAELGNVPPGDFISVAEDMGLITTIGAWGLEEACRTAAQWPNHLVVAVNLSPAQFYSGTLIADVRHALEVARFPAYRLEIEITEGTLLKDSDAVLEQLRCLREMGVGIALDDFGTGYSSLSYLWKFPFSKLKIDRAFVSALDTATGARGILRSIVKLGHGLGLSVTAEGIETEKQLMVLRDLGCDLAQGYLLDRPARVENLAAIIMRNFANGLPRHADKPSSAAAA